ncbi:MAG: 4Fe-4S binding protein [Chloroflexi bacterium]|nr:4Fe-4S binding protein [Chloroflexota bacterium]MBI3040493.1 4Fe-4S binding protein [Chloroflexota bacterium]MBI3930614.1 4Fe-4S binding protein [Chloroflexota bacterium]
MSQELKREARRLKMDFDALKSGGFIKQTQRDLFTVRLRCPGGKVTSQQLHKAAEIAEKYGRGEIHNSFRQSIEVPYVHYQHFDAIAAELKEINWSVASCGPRIRVPTACAGCTWNPNGLMDTQAMCFEVDKRYFGTASGHHKFKLSFSGCPIDCSRTREMDLGFQGIAQPELDEGLCNSCGLCVASCEEKALTMVNNLPLRDESKCIFCGDCSKVCPINAMPMKKKGWLARVGGKHGRHPIYAYEVAQFLSDEDCFPLIEKTMAWYQSNAEGRERIGAVIGRLGLTKYLDDVVKPLGLEVIETPEERRKYRAGGNMYT